MYYSLSKEPFPTEVSMNLSADYIMMSRKERQRSPETRHWPAGRAIYHNHGRDLAVWTNHSDHVAITSLERRGNVRQAVHRLALFLLRFERALRSRFLWDRELGHLSVHPALVGTGLEVVVVANLPNLATSYRKLKLICLSYDIVIRRQKKFVFELVNSRRLGITEFQILATFFNGIREILEYEQSLV